MSMISKEQLNRIAQSTGLSLYQQEKDYALKLFLYFYYKKFKDAVFKGGTCLKYVLGLNRFSEDLDFNLKDPVKFKEQTKKVLEELENLGIKSFFAKEELFSDSYTCVISFQGPLYNGNKQSENKFRIDAGYRVGLVRVPEWKLIRSEYPETEASFLVQAMDMEEIFIDKIIAATKRKKGRDLYDLWFMMNAAIKLDKQLLEIKIKKEKVKIDLKNLVSKEDYERDMSKLTTQLVPYAQVKDEVVQKLNEG